MDRRVSTYTKPTGLSPAARQLTEIQQAEQLPLGRIPLEERPLLALNLVEHAAASLGQKQLDEAVNRQLIKDLMEGFDLELATYTARELQFIITLGAKGRLTAESYGLSTATLFKWVQAYAERVKPLLLRERKRNPPPEPKPEPTPFTEEERREHVQQAREDWQNGGRIYLVTYEHLEALGLLQLTDAQKWQLVEEALQQLTIQFRQQRTHRSPAIRLTAATALKNLEKVNLKDARTLPENVKNQAKRLAVKGWFEGEV